MTAPLPNVRPTVAQGLVTFVGGLVLAGGSCAGFLATLNVNRTDDPVNLGFALGFILGLLVAGAGLLLLIVRLVRRARQRRLGSTTPASR